MTTKDKKPKRETFVSPKGTALWPKLNAPDTQYKKEGEYSVKLAFDPKKDPAVQTFLDGLQERFDTYIEEVKEEVGPAKAKKLKLQEPFTTELDEAGEETGRVVVKFGMAAQFTDKSGNIKKMKPIIVNALGTPIKNPPEIGNDSILRISYSIGGYNTPAATGIKLYLNGVQIVELVEFGGNRNLGFGVEEGGYTGEDTDAADDSEQDDTSGEDF
jgi:hypothetical protein